MLNAGDGTHEHPTQALLDAYTMRSRLGRLAGLQVAIVGDVLHSRVARSNVLLLHTLGAKVTAGRARRPCCRSASTRLARPRSPTTWTRCCRRPTW